MAAPSHGPAHPLDREIAERGSAHHLLRLFDFKAGSDEVTSARSVDAVVARPLVGRRADAQVDFLGAGGHEHPHDFAGSRPANEGVIDDHHSLSPDDRPDRIQLQLDAKAPDALVRLDESPADVMAPNDTNVERNSRFFGIAKRRRGAGIGHGDDEVRFGGLFARQLATKVLANFVGAPPVDLRVRASEVDALENAEVPPRPRQETAVELQLLTGCDDHLTRTDFADGFRVHDVESHRFGREDPGAIDSSITERSDTHGVADRYKFALRRKEEQRVGAAHLAKSFGDAVDEALLPALGHEVKNNFRVGSGLKDEPVVLEPPVQRPGVHQVAVVSHGDLAVPTTRRERLSVVKRGIAGCRIAHVTNRREAGQPVEFFLPENVADEAHRPMAVESLAISRDDARRLLAAMLIAMHPKVSVDSGLPTSPVSKNSAHLFCPPFPLPNALTLLLFFSNDKFKIFRPGGQTPSPCQKTPFVL